MAQPPSEYAQISGIYGPGNWAAWIITLITSWIPIFQNDHTHNLHYIGYVLYTNWATIDLIRQMVLAVRHQKEFGAVDIAQLQSLIAALAVMQMGILHASLQTAACRLLASGEDADTKRKIKRRRRYIFTGLLLPTFTNFFVAPYFLNLFAHHNKPGHRLFVTTSLSSLGVLFSNLPSWVLPERVHNMASVGIFMRTLIMWGVLVIVFLLSTSEMEAFSINGDAVLRKRCTIVPCTSQGIGEWDQAYAVMLALMFFSYEYGGGVLRRLRFVGKERQDRLWERFGWEE